MYLHADHEFKQDILARTSPSHARVSKYRPDDHLLDFLKHP